MINKTIIYTDVVGYSRLTGEDQELALELLSEHDKVLHQNTKHYNGEIIKKTGDGICCIFDDPVNAIKSCIDIQKDLGKRNKLNIKERQVQIRIGVHYGEIEKKGKGYIGESINIAQNIEPLAPHGGIAISEEVNALIWDSTDIYIREYVKFNYSNLERQTYEVYLDLINWYENEKRLPVQNVDFKSIYEKARSFFHLGDYSSAIKFANLALGNAPDNKKYEVESFICHTFISLGEFEYAKRELKKMKRETNINDEDKAHLLKMEANLLFNKREHITATKLFNASIELMFHVNKKYVNELVFYIANIFLLESDINKLTKYLDYVTLDDNYKILIGGIQLAGLNVESDLDVDKYSNNLDKISSNHMKALGFWYLAKYYKNFKQNHLAHKYISKSFDFLTIASDSISDWFQREKFLKNILIHKEIIDFSNSDFIDFSEFDLEVDEKKDIKSEENDSVLNIYKFCPKCGNNNSSNYKFCIKCGNNLQY